MRAVGSDASGLLSMLLCDIASLSRLSITIFSLTGKPLLQAGLYHSEEYATGKTEGVSLESADQTDQVICWDRGRLARQLRGAQFLAVVFPTPFALRAHCGRDARGPSKSFDRNPSRIRHALNPVV